MEAEKEKFNWRKFVDGLVPKTGVFWAKGFVTIYKALAVIIVIGLFISGILFVKNIFFKPKPKLAGNTTTTVSEGGKVDEIKNITYNYAPPDNKTGVFIGVTSDQRGEIGISREIGSGYGMEWEVEAFIGKDFGDEEEPEFLGLRTKMKF